MSQVRVHNFSISLDGFGTGDGLTLDAPFGHAGERLHEWMFATSWWGRTSRSGSSGIANPEASQQACKTPLSNEALCATKWSTPSKYSAIAGQISPNVGSFLTCSHLMP